METPAGFWILREFLSQGDIERLHGRDQPSVESIKKLAETEIPGQVDEILGTTLDELDTGVDEFDIPVSLILRILIISARVKGQQLRNRIVETEVGEWIVKTSTANLSVDTPSPSIFVTCPKCGAKIDDGPTTCATCGWVSG